MKKYCNFFFICILCLLLCSCNPKINISYSSPLWNTKKPNNYYYTKLLADDILNNKCKISILDTNFYKEKELSSDDLNVIKNFLQELKTDNFNNDKAKEYAKTKPPYKIFVTIENETKDKFVINVFDMKTISIHSWDGNYSVDMIDTSNVNTSSNLYLLCDYIVKSTPNILQ